jgi:hypothetical protein
MRRVLPILCLLLVAAVARAQQQEQTMLDRIETNYRKAMLGQDANGKKDPALTSSLSRKKFEGGNAAASKTFGTSEFGGTKSAGIKNYQTRSFLGVKNPWLGKKVFEGSRNFDAGKAAQESQQKYEAQSFAVREYNQGRKEDLKDLAAKPTGAAEPRPYLIQGKTQGGVDQFTQNVQKDLTIDDVRNLLNTGHK